MTDIPISLTALPTRLGVTARREEGDLVFRTPSFPETCRGGRLRTSVISYAVDAVAGIAVDADESVWTFTSDLSVRARPVAAPAWVDARAVVLRQGRRSSVCEVEVVDPEGRAVAHALLGFAAVPRRDEDRPKVTFPAGTPEREWMVHPRIDVPLPAAAGIEVVDAARGIVEVPITEQLCNPAGAMQGAMVALVAEVAAEELVTAATGREAVVTDLEVRYLAQARQGPVRSAARQVGGPDGPVRVELGDATTGQLLAVVVARTTTDAASVAPA